MLRDTYARIDLDAFRSNVRQLGRAAGTPLMAVVKADAYGHGAVQISKAAWETGVKWFAVSNPDEAIEIKKELPSARILVLSSVMPKACEDMVINGISVAAYLPKHLYDMNRAAGGVGRRAKVHLKADTGMGRIGFRTDEELNELLAAAKKCPDVEVEGLFTHFATADETDLSFAEGQLEKYRHFRKMVMDGGFKPLCHAANSAAIIAMKDAHFDLCRAGISMYGYPPSDEVNMGDVRLKPVMSLMSYVSYVKDIGRGDSVSYGRKFVAEGATQIATVPAGYADGYQRALSGKAEAFINGRRYRQVGRVCMDQIMFDVTGGGVKEGDEVELFGENIGADELAAKAGTISYELLTGVTKRVPRIFE